MTRRRRAVGSLLLAGLCICVVGCSSTLSRDTAKEIIEKRNLKGATTTTHIGTINGYCFDDELTNRLSLLQMNPDILKDASLHYLPMMNLGIIAIQTTGTPKTFKVTLTDAGRQAMDGEPYGHNVTKRCDQWQVDLKVAPLHHVQVTGIAQEGITAKVNATVCRKLTAFGEKFIAQPDDTLRMFHWDTLEKLGIKDGEVYCDHQTLVFRKYDDGWRIE